MNRFYALLSRMLATLLIAATFFPALTPVPVSAATRGDIVVTAFMADPTQVSDGVGEWITLRNVSERLINLNGWILTDEDRDTHVIARKDDTGESLMPFFVPSDQSVTLCRNADLAVNGGVLCDYAYGNDFQMKNQGDRIVLLNNSTPDAQEVDRIQYATYWYTEGTVTRLANLAGDNGNFQNWEVRPFFPYVADETTGALTDTTPLETVIPPSPHKQTAEPGDILVTEFMVDPIDVNDDMGEWLELYNNTNHAINLEGWTLTDGGADTHVVRSRNGVLPIEAGGYVTLCRSDNYLLNGGVACNYSYGNEDFQMRNDGDWILLKDIRGTTSFSVMYDGYWIRSGKSLALKALTNGRQAMKSTYNDWASETEILIAARGTDMGTPGRPKGVPAPLADEIPVERVAVEDLGISLPNVGTVLGNTVIRVGEGPEAFGRPVTVTTAVDANLRAFLQSGQPVTVMAWDAKHEQWETIGTDANIQAGQLRLRLVHGTVIAFVSDDPLAALLFSGEAESVTEEVIDDVTEEVIDVTEVPAAEPEVTRAPEPEAVPAAQVTERIFSDLAPTFWAYDYIRALKEAGVIHGYPDGTFRPHRYTNRAEMAKIALRAFNQKPHAGMTAPFKDVSDTDWFAPFVGKAHLLGVIQLAENDYFRPHRIVTRAEALALLLRASRLKLNANRMDTVAQDVQPTDWFYGYVRFAEQTGIIDATARFQPNRPANRADVAMMAARTLEIVHQAEGPAFFSSYEEMKASAESERAS